MHRRETIAEVLELAANGLGARRISQRTGVSTRTVTDWLRGRVPRSFADPGAGCRACGQPAAHVFTDLPPLYVYLLGLYLGDGCISSHPRGVFKLRVTLDARYPQIVADCVAAIRAVLPGNAVGRVLRSDHCVEVYCYSRSWPCLVPQAGPGKKHERGIELTPWQASLVDRHPDELLRGLIHSDGCRFQNTGRNWSQPRYKFDNRSEDIHAIFRRACDALGLRYTRAGITAYVSRKADVARMDQFIGPKR
jgi:hypothetical protein